MTTQAAWQHKRADVNGISLHYVEQGQGYPLILVHGFPETWYSWRHQIPALAEAGFHVIAVDLRGYGESDRPAPLEEYDIHHLVADLVGLMDALEIEKCVLIGHDWGSNVVWMTALQHPDRVERVVSLNIPYRGGPCMPRPEMLKKMDARFSYVVYFQEPGAAERFLESDVQQHLGKMYEYCAARPDFLSSDELKVFVDAFSHSGFTTPINLYRNIDRNWDTTEDLANKPVEQESLLILSDKQRTPVWPDAPWTPPGYDAPVSGAQIPEGLERFVPRLHTEMILDCGHWSNQEKPAEVNALILAFLGDLAARSR
ncbi:MAG TPA: alpha/beta hydrolase [Dehalococcoidia bacterium]|nr:alpha/beta hydrolase [Dehalococcoidia bacterium]